MAVLLDNFITASTQMEQREKELDTARLLRDNQSRSPLEPLLVKARACARMETQSYTEICARAWAHE